MRYNNKSSSVSWSGVYLYAIAFFPESKICLGRRLKREIANDGILITVLKQKNTTSAELS